jgi:hypothetical protein
MSDEVEVSRRIGAGAAAIWAIVTDPVRHLELDGSGMLRGAVTTMPLTAAGQVFVMAMFYEAHGAYEMDNHVVGFEPGRYLAWEPRPGRGHPDLGVVDADGWHHRWWYRLTPDGPDTTVVTEGYDCSRVPAAEAANMDGGRIWLPSMSETLRRLERAVTLSPCSAYPRRSR